MPLIELRKFSEGVQSDTGFSRAGVAASEELRNLTVDRQGRQSARAGSTRPLVTAEETGLFTNIFRISAQGTINTPRRVFFGLQFTAQKLRRWNGSTAYAALGSAIASMVREEFYTAPVMFRDRLFMPRGGISAGAIWIDVEAATPTWYTLGRAAPTAPTLAVNGNGANDLTANAWYSFSYTYYNSAYGIETAPTSKVAIQAVGATLTVRVTTTLANDAQWDQTRIYRSRAMNTQAAAESATHYLVGTFTHTAGAGTDNSDISGSNLDFVIGGGFTAYTLGDANETGDHDQMADDMQFVAVYADRLWWAGGRDRNIRSSKKTTESVYPDWAPSEQEITLGATGEYITGLVPLPSGGGLYIFTERNITLLRGDNIPNTVDQSLKIEDVGCPFPRTIVVVGGVVMFVGTDNQVWELRGTEARPVSRGVNNYLTQLNPAWKWLPCAAQYKNQYWLSYPSGALTTSSTGTTVTSPGGGTLTSHIAFNIADGAAWDLSAVKVGMWVFYNTNPERNAIISAVNDGTDTLTTEDWRVNIPADGYAYDVVANNRVLIYDATYRYWTGPHRNYDVNGFSWWNGPYDNGELYAALSDGGFVDRLDTGTTDTGSVAITSLWRSNWIDLGKLSRVKGIQIATSAASVSLTGNLYRDQSSTAAATSANWRRVGTNIWRCGLFARCSQCLLELTGTSYPTVERVWIEVE